MKLKGLKKGLMIPNEIWEMDELETIEKTLFAIYCYFTKGSKKGCVYTNKTLADFLKVSEHSIQNYKAHLKQLNLIEVNGQKTNSLVIFD